MYIHTYICEYMYVLCVLSRSDVSDSLQSHGCSQPGSSVHGDSPGKNTGVGCHALLQGNLPNPGIEPRSSALQAELEWAWQLTPIFLLGESPWTEEPGGLLCLPYPFIC